ncbi:MAG: alpha/beta fold hydrolase [Myxococcota bacterium]
MSEDAGPKPADVGLDGADGLRLHGLEWSRTGVPLLLVHGFSNEAHIWDDFAPAVAPYYRTLAIDLRGHGDSDWDPEARYDYDHHVADLEAVVAGLDIERMVLVGHSLGGRVGTLFAGRNPDKLAGFVLVDSAPELDKRGTLRIRMDAEADRDPSFAQPAEYESALSLAYPAATPAALRRMARYGLRRRDDGRFVPKMDPAYRGFGRDPLDEDALAARERDLAERMWSALESLACPTLVVRGAASDVLAADMADRMVDEVIPDAKLAVVAQAGHSVMTDNPDGFREAVCAFVLGE